MIYENLAAFKGRPVEDWAGAVSDPSEFDRVVFRLRVEYDDETSIQDKFAELAESPGTDRIQSLVIGAWQGDNSDAEPAELVEAMVAARERLPGLRNLFFGDIISEENEISWIHQTDVSPLLGAYPKLEHLTVRGGTGLSFGGALAHDSLRELIVQTGGLPPDVLHEIAAARLPALEHLELWLGAANYGGDATVEDVSPFLTRSLFPKLRYLGLKNSEIEDEIAGVAALSPVVAQLQVLDLSLGTLGDEGARALLASPGVRKLKKLDLHHHYISEPVQKELKSLGIDVDLSDVQTPEEWGGVEQRFVSVSE